MDGAAGWEGWVNGSGRLRKNDTSGRSEDKRAGGNGVPPRSAPGAGVGPDEPSATSLVYICVSFFAPVSSKRAWNERALRNSGNPEMTTCADHLAIIVL
jgi:hypothetical protein